MIGSLVIALASTVALAQAPESGCGKDSDCKGDRICVKGECQAPTAPVQEEERTPASGGAGRAPMRNSLFGFQADLGGFLVYGPALSFEIGSRVAFVGTVRAVGLGAVRRVLAGNNSVSLTDWAAGGGFRVYTGSQALRQGFYIGATFEYASTEETEGDTLPKGVAIRYQTQALVAGVDTGYRWVFSNGMTLGVGAIVGLYHPLEAKMTVSGGSPPSGYRNEASDTVAPLLVCEVGFGL